MWERIDEWLMNHLSEFDGKKLISVTSGDLELGDLEDEESRKQQEEATKANAGLIERLKSALGSEVQDVRVSHRLTETPVCAVTDAHGMSSQMMKLMKAAGQPVPEQKYILEVNPEHALIRHIADVQDEERFKEWAQLLQEQAQLTEQGGLTDPASFVARMNRLLLG